MFKFKNFIFLLSIFSLPLSANIMNPDVCKTCHDKQHKEWVTSLHAKSHKESNELYKKVVSWTANERLKIYDNQLIECGDCHNPKLELKKMDSDMYLAAALGVDTAKTQELKTAIGAQHIKSGVSCYICHNVDSIKPKENPRENGYKLFNWTPGNLIVGPYKINTTIFHSNDSRDFFRENDSLCLSCHQGQATENPLSAYNTGNESANAEKRCVDCHMGSLRSEVIAPNIKRDDMSPKEVKSHFFKGARNSDILKEALDFSVEKLDTNKVKLSIHNLISHSVPTGFSGRSVVFEISFLKGNEVIEKQNLDLRAVYENSLRAETFSYGAKNLVSDTRLKPNETREYEISYPAGATSIKINVVYYVLAPQLQKLLELKSVDHTKPYEAMSKTFNLK